MREHFVCVDDECLEQAVFGGGKLDLFVAKPDYTTNKIDAKTACLKYWLIAMRRFAGTD